MIPWHARKEGRHVLIVMIIKLEGIFKGRKKLDPKTLLC